ncbi:MAG: tetratricopeptide repeat protein, partial [Cyclobacteriaceae bacterium]|nr:tetratricopeptide repeat protein [Cyclobacteriaceae bacterium]
HLTFAMNKPYILIFAIFISLQSLGQKSSVMDSLLTELESAQEDTVKVEILLRLFNPTVINDLELAYEYTDQAQMLSEKLSFDKGIAAAFQRKGIIWGYRGNVKKARENYLKAIEVHQRLDHELIAATLIFNLGLLYQEQGNYDSALVFNEKAAEIFLSYNDSLKYASSLDLFSSIHNEKGNYFLNLKYATEAADIFHKYGDELREADALIKIGMGFGVLEDYRSAIEYYESAIKLYQKHDDKHWENFAIQKIAQAYLSMNDLTKADSIIDYSLQLSDSLGAIQTLSEGYDVKGEIFFAKGEFNRAIEYFQKALKTNEDAADSTFIATEHISIGRCYQQLGLSDKAMNSYLSVLPISLKMDVKENLKTIYANVSELYEHSGNEGQAFNYYKKYVNVKDSIYNNEKSRLIADMQTKYDTDRKEKEIALQNQTITILEQKAEIQELIRMRLIVSIVVVVIFFLLGFYVLWLRMKKNKLKQEIENERLTFELDLKKRELTTHTLHIIQKNELLENLQSKVTELKQKDVNHGSSYNQITRLINTNRLIERDWGNFKSVFEQVHPDFFTKLKSLYANISANELRMAAMMKMNLNTKEMASILNITPESVKKARYRMRKKFDLVAESNVQEYLIKL